LKRPVVLLVTYVILMEGFIVYDTWKRVPTMPNKALFHPGRSDAEIMIDGVITANGYCVFPILIGSFFVFLASPMKQGKKSSSVSGDKNAVEPKFDLGPGSRSHDTADDDVIRQGE
jgi:hypothetical protein